MFKQIISYLAVVFVGVHGYAQNQQQANQQPTSQQLVHQARYQYFQHSRLYQNTLLNRNLEFDEDLLLHADGISDRPTINADTWITTLGAVLNAKKGTNSYTQGPQFYQRIANYVNANAQLGEVIPIGIIDQRVTRIKENAYTQQRITLNGSKFVDNGLRNKDFEQADIFLVSPLAEAAVNEEVVFALEQQFYVSNRTEKIEYLLVDLDDGQAPRKMYFGDKIRVKIKANQIIKFQAKFLNHPVVKWAQSNFQWLIDLFSDEKIVFDENSSVSNSEGDRLLYSIKYGCGNKELRKPLIVAHGMLPPDIATIYDVINFLPGSPPAGLPIYHTTENLYNKFNYEHTLDEMRARGYDIVVVLMEDNYASMMTYGRLIRKLIHTLNNIKFDNGSYYENVVIGYSLGAVATKFALDEIEHDLMKGLTDQHHHTKLWVSYDGGHHGANVPLAVQHAVAFAWDELNSLGIRVQILNHMLRSEMGREAPLYHYTKTGSPSSPTQGPANLKITLDNTFNSLVHSKTVVNRYPAFSRNIAIAQGAHHTSNTPYLFSDGGKFFDKDGLRKTILTATKVNTEVFRYKPLIGSATAYQVNGNALEVDNAPGSWNFGMYADAMTSVVKNYPGNITHVGHNSYLFDFNCKLKFGGPWCFVPVVSAFAYNTAYLGIDRDWSYNAVVGGLMNYEPGSFNGMYGYPNVEHPTDHFRRTPFEALWADNRASHHITVKPRLINNCYLRDTDIPEQANIKRFLLNEVAPYNLALQNKDLGDNTRTSGSGPLSYKAFYEASAHVKLGYDVTWITDKDYYRVLDNAHLETKAGRSVTLEPGFEATKGSVYHGYIEATDCELSGDEVDYINKNRLAAPAQPKNTAVDALADAEDQFLLYPNPTNGIFTVKWTQENQQPTVLKVYDLTGKVLHQENIRVSGQSINLSHFTHGIYIVQIQNENTQQTRRLVIQ